MTSSISLNLRYQKSDQYGNHIFIASSKYPEEIEAFNRLVGIEAKLKGFKTVQFLPVFSSEDLGYATIRFKFYPCIKLVARNKYTIAFNISQTTGVKHYINCNVQTIKLHSKAIQQDIGTILDIF